MASGPQLQSPPLLPGLRWCGSKKWFVVQCVGMFFVVCCVRFYYVSSLGVAVPYWDQWDAIGWQTFRPVLADGLSLDVLFRAHNEHWIPLTRLQSLILFWMNSGQWDPAIEMLVNVVIAGAAAVAVFATLGRHLTARNRIVFFMITSIVWLHPADWANFLGGFQGAFYLLILFLAIAFYSLTLSNKWLAAGGALLSGCLATFALGGGLLVWPALAVALVIVAYSDRRLRSLYLVFSLAAILVGLMFARMAPVSEKETVFAVGALYRGIVRAGSWPLPPNLLSCVLIALLPASVLLRAVMRRRINDTHIPQLAGLAWVAGTVVALIVYRDFASGLHSRHTLFLGYGALCMVSIVLRHTQTHESRWTPAWLVILCAALGAGYPAGWEQAIDRSETNRLHETKVRDYLIGDAPTASLLHTRHLAIPLNSGKRLVRYLDDPEYRSWLPGNLFAAMPEGSGTFVNPGVGPGIVRRFIGSVRGSYNRGQRKALPKGAGFTGAWEFSVVNPTRGTILALPVVVNGRDKVVVEVQSSRGTERKEVGQHGDSEWQWVFFDAPGNGGGITVSVNDSTARSWVAIGPPRFTGLLTKFRLLLSEWASYILLGGLAAFGFVITCSASVRSSCERLHGEGESRE